MQPVDVGSRIEQLHATSAFDAPARHPIAIPFVPADRGSTIGIASATIPVSGIGAQPNGSNGSRDLRTDTIADKRAPACTT